MAAGELNARQRRFITEYLVDQNGTQAAIRAGYAKRSAHVTASLLISNANVKAAIDKQMSKMLSKIEVTAERVLAERARLAFFDVRKLIDATGKPKPIHELDDDTAAAIAGVEVANIGNSQVGEGEVLKIRMADKNASLTALEKHLGLYKEGGDSGAPLQINIHL